MQAYRILGMMPDRIGISKAFFGWSWHRLETHIRLICANDCFLDRREEYVIHILGGCRNARVILGLLDLHIKLCSCRLRYLVNLASDGFQATAQCPESTRYKYGIVLR